MTRPRFAELFAGAGGLSLGLERAGWEHAWHAEISAAPRAILAHRWPNVPLLGDVTTLDGKALTALHGPIDLLSGGSPCQDLSVAGKRKGLEGARSGLFFEQMRLWDETGADLCLWENVDGARSSNNGKDFGEVLRAFVGAPIPVPSDGWRSAGVAAGPRGVAAWRVLDAQYFGVPQRRRRVFVLGTRTGRVDPAEVLSLAEGVRGDSQASGEAGEGTPRGAVARAHDASGHSSPRPHRPSPASSTERDGNDHGRAIPLLEPGKRTGTSTTDIRCGSGIGGDGDPMFTLQAGAQHGVISFDWQKGNDVNNPRPSTMAIDEECTGTLAATRVPAVLAIDLAQVTSKANRSQPQPQSPTLNGSGQVIAFGHQNSPAQGDGVGEIVATLDKSKTPAVLAFDAKQDGSDASEVAPTLLAAPHDGSHPNGGGWIGVLGEVSHSLTNEGADASEDGTGRGTPVVVAPRRLTPRECERLMDWPDDWTLVPDAKGKLLSDAARYKACGNGVASCVAEWIGERLRLALESSPTSCAFPSAPSPETGPEPLENDNE